MFGIGHGLSAPGLYPMIAYGSPVNYSRDRTVSPVGEFSRLINALGCFPRKISVFLFVGFSAELLLIPRRRFPTARVSS